ncbi:MAG: hypothetical protein JZU52_18765, partial [Lamprocystis purpurea]|nr:hypothetical protein [Lamprocystis purpurea]
MSLAADSHGQASLIAGERRQSINTDEDATWMRVLIRCTLMALLVAVVSAVVLAVLTAPINVVGAMQVNTFVIYHAALVNAGLQLLAMIGMSTYLRRRDLQHWWDTADGNAKARGLFFVLLCCQLLLATAFWLTHGRGLAYYGYLRALFGFDDEFNLPALFSSMQLGLASGLAFAGYRVIPRQERMWTWAWPFAGTILLYMAMDELLTIHEHVGYLVAAHSWSQDGTRGIIEIGNWRIRPWTLVFFPLALAIGLVLARG